MRRKISLATVLALVVIMAACAAKNKVPAPLPVGAINSFDANCYRVLADAQAALQSIRDDSTAGKITMNPTQKSIFNQLTFDYNTANHLWQAYHSTGTGNTAPLQAAITKLQSDILSASAQIQGGK